MCLKKYQPFPRLGWFLSALPEVVQVIIALTTDDVVGSGSGQITVAFSQHVLKSSFICMHGASKRLVQSKLGTSCDRPHVFANQDAGFEVLEVTAGTKYLVALFWSAKQCGVTRY